MAASWEHALNSATKFALCAASFAALGLPASAAPPSWLPLGVGMYDCNLEQEKAISRTLQTAKPPSEAITCVMGWPQDWERMQIDIAIKPGSPDVTLSVGVFKWENTYSPSPSENRDGHGWKELSCDDAAALAQFALSGLVRDNDEVEPPIASCTLSNVVKVKPQPEFRTPLGKKIRATAAYAKFATITVPLDKYRARLPKHVQK